MSLGYVIKQYIPHFLITLISCGALVLLGIFFMIEGYIKNIAANRSDCDNTLLKFGVPRLGIIINIALDLSKADMDVSGDINIREALYLGLILSIDSFATGFSVALTDINSFIFLLFVFCINLLSIFSGLIIGKKIDKYNTDLKISLLPGFILFLVGVLKFI